MKRGIMSKDQFRFTVQGADVDTAQDWEFVLHDEHLCAQAYYMKSVPCPFTGTSGAYRSTSVRVTTPARNSETVMLHYLRASNSGGYFPFPPSDGSTGIPTGAIFDIDYINSTTMDVYFEVPANVPAPQDLFIVYMRGTS